MGLKLSGVSGFKRNLKALENIDTLAIVTAGGDVMRDKARGNVRKKLNRNARGQLENDITTHPVSEREVEVGVQEDAESAVYAHVHEYGHEGIVPKQAGALFIPLKDGAEPGQSGLEMGEDFVLTQKVVIPERAYLRPAVDTSRRQVKKAMRAEAKKQMKGAIR